MNALLVIMFLFPNGKTIEKKYPMKSMTECMSILHRTKVVHPRTTGQWGYYKTCAYRLKKKSKSIIKKK